MSRVPLPPPGFQESAFFDGVHWHQRWEVLRNVFLPGRNDVSELLDRVGLPQDLSGLRVLDVGAWNGAFSFECERRGAREVLALSLEDPQTSGFAKLRTLLDSAVSYELGSVYNLDSSTHGTFDVVLFLGVLYHLRYPLLGADKLRSVTAGTLFIESHVIDHCFIAAGATSERAQTLAEVSPALVDVALWQFYRHDELGSDPSNWFGPNIKAVVDGFGSAGFTVRLTDTWGTRAAFQAQPTRVTDLPRTYEGQSQIVQQGLGLRFDVI